MERPSIKNPMNTGPAPQAPGEWLQLFDEKNVQFIILDPHTDAEMVEAIRSQPGWIIDFEDDEVVTFASSKPH